MWGEGGRREEGGGGECCLYIESLIATTTFILHLLNFAQKPPWQRLMWKSFRGSGKQFPDFQPLVKGESIEVGVVVPAHRQKFEYMRKQNPTVNSIHMMGFNAAVSYIWHCLENDMGKYSLY